MQYIVKLILTAIIPVLMQVGVINTVSSTPQEAVNTMMDGLKTCNEQELEKYMDNTYVNLLMNLQGDEKVVDRMYAALFENFQYEIVEIAQKNDVAVAKVAITGNDFHKVLKAYDKSSYDYVMKNLYTEDIADKKKLNGKCLDLYVKEIEKAAKKEPVEETIFIPLADNGSYGWNVLLSDELMKEILGDLALPELS